MFVVVVSAELELFTFVAVVSAELEVFTFIVVVLAKLELFTFVCCCSISRAEAIYFCLLL